MDLRAAQRAPPGTRIERVSEIRDHLLFLLLGLGSGAVYAALGLGLVLVYRGSGVINFAHGAMAMYSVFTYAELRDTGDFVIPVPGLPSRINLGEHVPFATALVLALLSTALLGYLVHLLVFRPLRHSTALSKVVASVGIMIVLQSIVVLRFGASVRSISPILPDEGVRIWNMTIPRDRFFLAGLVILLATALWAVSRWTRFGLATRAAAESEKGASLLGYSPELISAANWILASVVGGTVAILVSPITGLDPVNFTLLVVPALGCALVGRLSSFGGTVAAGLTLGMLQSEITKLQVEYTWMPRIGVKEGLPFLVIIAVLFFAGKSLPTRGTIAEKQVPIARSPHRVGLTALVSFTLGTVALLALDGGYRFGLITSYIVAVICLSLVVLTGYVGQISLAQMSFAGVSGFALSKMAAEQDLPFPLSPMIAVAVATMIGLLVGLPALRVRGVHLAVITVAAAVALEEFVFKNPRYSGGFSGSPVPDPSLFGFDFGIRGGDTFPRPAFGVFVLSVLTVLAVFVANLRRSAGGRRMLAVRSNERAAAAAGISVTGTKLAAFTFSSFLAGVGGVLIGYQRGQLSASSFGVFVSLGVLATAYLGGITSVSGAIAGGFLAAGGLTFTALDRWIDFGRFETLATGASLVAVAILYPEGVAGAIRNAARPVLERLRPSQAAPPVAAVGSIGSRSHLRPRPAPGDGERPLLSVVDLEVTYSGLRAVDGVSLTIAAGDVVGLIGPNGAGKTTFVDALTGFVPSSAGQVIFEGTPIGHLPAHLRARAGISRTFQSVQLFDDLTVRENVLVAAEHPRWWSLMGGLVAPNSGADDDEVAGWALDLVGLTALADRFPSELSYGQRKLVGLARAVASRPRLLLLDEPAAGLDTHESRALGERLRSLSGAGITVMLIDHDMGLVLGICDVVHVLNFGTLVSTGSPAEVRADPRVIAAYLGERSAERNRAETVPAPSPDRTGTRLP